MGLVQPRGHVIQFTGQVAWDAAERIVGKGDVRRQTEQCFDNIGHVLEAVGGIFDDLVSVTTYFLDREHLAQIQSVRAGYLTGPNPPVSTSVMVAGLGHADFLVELTPVAVIPPERFVLPSQNTHLSVNELP